MRIFQASAIVGSLVMSACAGSTSTLSPNPSLASVAQQNSADQATELQIARGISNPEVRNLVIQSTLNPHSTMARTRPNGKVKKALGAGDFQWVLNKTDSVALAECPSGWTVIAGGGRNATDTGISGGTGTKNGNGWLVSGSGLVNAFASCVDSAYASDFVWEGPQHLGPGAKQVNVDCPSGYPQLIMGYANGEDWEAGVYGTSPEHWAAGVYNTGAISAYASCAKSSLGLYVHAIWTGNSPGRTATGCPTGTPVLIAGSMGDDLPNQNSFWPGPPSEEYPATSANLWWVWSGIANLKNNAICAP
jgi:hypothetical protein